MGKQFYCNFNLDAFTLLLLADSSYTILPRAVGMCLFKIDNTYELF